MNGKRFYMVLFVLATTSFASAQANLLNSQKVEEIGFKSEAQIASEDDKPLPYGYISDRDVLWSKVVWEYVDLTQKINLPYYYPIDTTSAGLTRRSLFDTLLKGIKTGEIKEVYSDSYFTSKIGMDEIKSRILYEHDTGYGIDPYSIQSADIKGYTIKGLWYFDKRGGELKYRMLAIAPMGPDVKFMHMPGAADDNKMGYELFWVFFPDARNTLHASKVFNPKNTAHPLSYDNLLNARRFNATILKEENIYGDRSIKDYVRGNSLFQLLEADRIKESIRNREMDMWNY